MAWDESESASEQALKIEERLMIRLDILQDRHDTLPLWAMFKRRRIRRRAQEIRESLKELWS